MYRQKKVRLNKVHLFKYVMLRKITQQQLRKEFQPKLPCEA